MDLSVLSVHTVLMCNSKSCPTVSEISSRECSDTQSTAEASGIQLQISRKTWIASCRCKVFPRKFYIDFLKNLRNLLSYMCRKKLLIRLFQVIFKQVLIQFYIYDISGDCSHKLIRKESKTNTQKCNN